MGFNMGAGDWNSGPCTIKTLLTKPSPQPHNHQFLEKFFPPGEFSHIYMMPLWAERMPQGNVYMNFSSLSQFVSEKNLHSRNIDWMIDWFDLI